VEAFEVKVKTTKSRLLTLVVALQKVGSQRRNIFFFQISSIIIVLFSI